MVDAPSRGMALPGTARWRDARRIHELFLGFLVAHEADTLGLFLAVFLMQGHVETQTHEFLDQNVEGFGQTGFQEVVALDDLLVHLHASGHVVGLDGKEFLQEIGGAVGFQSPDFHFTQTLATELRLTAQRLLGDQAVGAGGAGVDLFVDQVVQLQDVHDTGGHAVLEGHAGTAVVQDR